MIKRGYLSQKKVIDPKNKLKMNKYFFITVLLLASLYGNAQKFKGLALTPPMGWNSWNTFQANISEALVKETVDYLVSSGMKDAGYTYIVLDDGWMAMQRDSMGNLVPDPKKFPHGMKAVADYVHSKGLKFGLYNCAGTKTCGGYPGTRGYEYQDARLYAAIGIDYLKFDWCSSEGLNAKEAYTTMSKAIQLAGRPVVFSLCEWGSNKPWEWGPAVGQLWRTTGDIYNCFDCEKKFGGWSGWGVVQIIDKQKDLRKYAGPDHWNDPDMLEVGNGISMPENRAHFAIWCMMSAPLIAGNDLRKMDRETAKVLTDKDLIAINQDKLGVQGFPFTKMDSVEVWLKPLENEELAICFFNRSVKNVPVIFDWKSNPVTDTISKMNIDFNTTKYAIRNLYSKKEEGNTAKVFKSSLLPHDAIVLRLRKDQKK